MRRFRRAVQVGILAILSSALGCSSDATPSEIQDLINSLQVTLGLSQIQVGQTVQAGAIARNASGGTLNGVTIAWSSSNTAVATVSSTGAVTGVAPGSATITGTVGAKSATANVTVVQVPVASVAVNLSASSVLAGTPVTATATTRDGANNVLTNRAVTWSSSNASVATISATGAIITLSAGTTTITATSENVTGVATLIVTQVGVASVSVTLGSSLLNPGASTTATASARDAAGNVLAGRPVTWASSNLSVATVNSSGVVTAVTAGSATITATIENVTGSAGVTVQSSVTSVTVAIAQNPISVTKTTTATATVRDINNTVLTNRAVTWASSNNAVATVSATGTITGVAVGTATITATSEGVTGSAPVTVQVGVGSVSVTIGAPQIRVGLSTSATAVVRDPQGTTLTDRTVTWSSSAPSIANVDPNGGVVGISVGTATITANVDGVTGSASVSVVAPTGGTGSPATQLVITQQPSGASSGVGFATPATVEVRDANNALVAGSNNSIAVSIASGSGQIAGSTSVTAVNGVATFSSLKINGIGAHSLTFSANGLTSATSNSFNVTQAPGRLIITTQPSGGVTGQALTTQPVVQIADAAGVLIANSALPVTATISNGNGTLLGTTTVNAVNGVATFTNLRVDGSSTHVLTFSISTPSVSVASQPFSVQSGLATQLVIAVQPSGSVSGVNLAQQPIVHVRDVANQTVVGATQQVTASIASGTGTLVGNTSVTAVNGIATFTNLRINGSGPHTLQFTSNPLTPATSNSMTTTQNITSLSVQTQPVGGVSGSQLATQPVVRLLDAAGLPVVGANNTVTAFISSGSGTLGGTTQVAAVNGVATFSNLSVTGTGNFQISFSIGSPALSVASNQFAMTAAPATQLAIAVQPGGAVSGVSFTSQPVIHVRDANNNTVAGAGNSVTAAITNGSGALVGTSTVTAVNGVATFTNLRIDGVGAHTITFTSTGLTQAVSQSFNVTQNVASLSVQTQPAGAVNGQAFTTQPVVRLVDNAGLTVTSATHNVTAVVSSGSGTLGGTVTVAAVNGVATFTNLQIAGSGNHQLTFSTTSPSLSAQSQVFNVGSAGQASQLVITTQPAGAVSGVNLTTQPVVQIRDANNNLVTSATNAVTATIASGSGAFANTSTVTINAVNGVATFTNLRINGAGSHTITFSTTGGVTSATSSAFTVTQQAASVSIQTQPSGATTGSALTTQPVIRILDNAGLVVTSSNAAVTASVASGSPTIHASSTNPVNAVNGVATFTNLRLDGNGSVTLRFSIANPSVNVVSSAFNVAIGPVSAMSIVTQPSANASSGFTFGQQPVVKFVDVAGQTVTSYNTNVTAAIGTNAGGTLNGTTTVTPVNGVATFTNLGITGNTGAYTLTFTSGALNQTSSTVNLVSPGTMTGSITGGPTTGTVELVSGSTVVASGTVSGGTYNIPGIAPGTYTARYHPPLDYSIGSVDPQVTITSGGTTMQNFSAQAAYYSDDFQSYTSTSQILKFCSGPTSAGDFWHGAGLDGNCSIGTGAQIVLDPTGGKYNDKAVRYDWPSRPTCPNGPTNCSFVVSMSPRYSGVSGSEFWIRFTDKLSSNFIIGGGGATGSQAEYKYLFLDFIYNGKVNQAVFELDSRSGGAPNGLVSARTKLIPDPSLNLGYAASDPCLCQGGGADVNLPNNFTGSWSTWVVGITGIGSGQAVYNLYRDGVLLKQMPGPWPSGALTGYVQVQMGANINNGPDQVQSRWWREFAIYKTRPSLLPLP